MSSKRKWDQAAPEELKDDPESPSKIAKVDESKNASTAAAVAAIAAKIAAQFSSGAVGGGNGLLGPKDIHDGEFTQDIDINDLRNRYMLTKGSTQQQVRHSFLPLNDGNISRTFVSIFFFRYTMKQELLSAQKAYGTQIVRRLRRKTRRCTYTYLLIRKKCYRGPLTKSMNSSQSTWALWSKIRESAKRCVLFRAIWGCYARSHPLSVSGRRRKSSSD